MGHAPCAGGEPHVQSERGRWYVPVPWDTADNLQSLLKRKGLSSTVCLDPEARRARLELWPGVSPDAVLDALGFGPVAGKSYPVQAAA